jgi:electron transport complex protein RnfG
LPPSARVGRGHLYGTKDIIAEAQRAALEASLNQLVPADRYDNRVVEDRIEVVAPEWLGTDQPVQSIAPARTASRSRCSPRPPRRMVTAGRFNCWSGFTPTGRLAGVRVLAHKETPGLGDGIDEKRSPWILAFAGKSLENPWPDAWKVKKDGGVFDQFTGATITPRAVVKATRKFLDYVRTHREQLFAVPPTAKGQPS